MRAKNRSFQNISIKTEIGEVWTTKDKPLLPDGSTMEKISDPRCVVIILDDEDAYDPRFPDIRVAPISTEIEYACNHDLILSADENPLKKRIMIELWNSQPMLKMNLGEFLGKLSESVIDKLVRLDQNLWGMNDNVEGIETGEPIVEPSDERLAFQKREVEATSYISSPVGALLEKWEREETKMREVQIVLDVWKKSGSLLKKIRTQNCLSSDQMERYLQGLYSGENLQEILKHLASCPHCSVKAAEERKKRKTAEHAVKIAAAISEIMGKVTTEHHGVFIRYDASLREQLDFRMRLEKFNVHALDDLINPIASVDDNGAVCVASARSANISRIWEAKRPLIVISSPKELISLAAESIPEIPIKWNMDIFAVQIPGEAPATREWQAKQACERFTGITNPREVILAILDHGASDEVIPLSWLERMGYIKSNPHPLIKELSEFSEVIAPINPHTGETPKWEEAQYFTATDGEVARMILERMGRWNGRARTDYYKNLINSVITEETEPLSEDAKLMCRLLHALYLRGWRSTLYYVLRDTQKAMRPLLDGLLKEVKDVRYLMAWGKVYAKGGDLNTAINLLEVAEAKANEQDLPYILRVRAGLSLDLGETGEAIDYLQRASELQPENITVLTALATAYTRIPGPREETFQLTDRIKELEPDSPYPYQIAGYAHMRLGLETSQRGHFTEAAAEFDQVLEKDPNNVPTLTAWAEMAMERGHLRPQRREYNREPIFSAEDLLNKALEIEPLNVPTLVSLGRLHTELREYPQAMSYLRQALSQLPQNVQALTALAHLYTQQGNFEKTGETLERAAGVYGENVHIVAERGRMLIKQGELDRAIDILKTEIEHTEDGLSKIVLLNLLVKAYCKKGDFVTAAECYTRATEIQPRNPQTYNNWVECLCAGHSKDDIEKIVTMLKGRADMRFCPQLHPQEVATLIRRLDVHNSYILEICGFVEKLFGDEEEGERLLQTSYELGLARRRELDTN